MVVNGHHYTREVQRFPICRFQEMGGAYDPLALGDGERPPFVPSLPKYCHLDAPVALGNRIEQYGEEAKSQYAKFVMKSVITHLRHGVLYYYYGVEIPEEGPGSGEYGPLNHMYPITPLELHEGWVLGKERIITAISLKDVLWEKKTRPIVHLFDIAGREVTGRDFASIERHGAEWSISLKLNDWGEIAVVE